MEIHSGKHKLGFERHASDHLMKERRGEERRGEERRGEERRGEERRGEEKEGWGGFTIFCYQLFESFLALIYPSVAAKILHFIREDWRRWI